MYRYPWKSIIQIDKQARRPVYLQIANAITTEISQGRLAPRQKLPGTRAMAQLLGVNRKTMQLAYEELDAQGWIESIPSKGTFVSGLLPTPQYQNLAAPSPNHKELDFPPFEIPYNPVLEAYRPVPPNVVTIDDGSPDVRLAPLEALSKNYRTIVRSPYSKQLLRYSDVKGEMGLRRTLAQYLNETRGLHGNENNILITRGSQMAIFLYFNTLLRPGDHVIVGETNYNSADWVIQNSGAKLIRVPVDEDGIVVEKVEKACRKEKIKAIYITPHHHFPTTVTLTAGRRIELLKVAEEYNVAIFEDDYDYDYHYKSSPILPLASQDTQGRVAYSGSFSKLIAPSVRVGYLMAPSRLIDQVSKWRRIVDRQGDPLLERALAMLIREGEVQRHLKKAVRIYKRRRDLFCSLLEQTFGDAIRFRVPDGGMAVWVEFAPEFSLPRFSELLQNKGLYFNVDQNFVKEKNAIRMGFASINEEEIRQRFDVIKDCFRDLR